MNVLINGILVFLQLFFSSLSGVRQSDDLRLMVISDPHLMAPELLQEEGKAFNDYVSNDRKMLKESPVLLEEAVQAVLRERPQVVLIPGDLTKDGETVSHLLLRDAYLRRLREAGIQVYVVPGNHDVDNPHAVVFHGSVTRRVPTPTAAAFAELYSDYGYGKAMARDTASLSYVVQIAPKTRLLALDGCMYEENSYESNRCVTGGRLKESTLQFIEEQGRQARRDGQRLLAMVHHGVVQHWTWQEKIMGEYLVRDWRKVASLLERQGVEVVFTGHFHAQDISRRGRLYDVETGSLVSYPSPYRSVTIHGDKMTVTSHRLTGEGLRLADGQSPADYSRSFACEGINNTITSLLPKTMPSELRSDVCDEVCKAYIAHLDGDERMPDGETAAIESVATRLKAYSRKLAHIFSRICESLWTDLEPGDDTTVISLTR